MNSNNTFGDLPLGFSLALAQNADSLNHFASLSDNKQKEVIDKAKNIKSKEEMHSYVKNLKTF